MAVDPRYVQGIARAARQTGVNPVLALAIALEESGGRANAVGDQGTSFGAYQLHRGGALGSLSPQAAFDPYTNAMAVLPSWAKAGGGRGLSPQSALMQYYSQVGRGTSNTIPTQHALALIPQARQLLGQAGAPVPAVGAQPQQQTGLPGLTSAMATRGLAPQLLAALSQYGERVRAAAQQGQRLALPKPLLSQLAAAQLAARRRQAEVPAVGNAPTTGTSRYSGAIPGPVKGLDYPLGSRGPIIGLPYQGTHRLYGNWESDNAVDIKVPVGTPVVAPADGVVGSQIGALGSGDPRLEGLRVHLDGPTDSFYFAHLSRLAVRPGQHVRAGDVIGYSGSANGVAHLHLASRNRDPRAYVGG